MRTLVVFLFVDERRAIPCSKCIKWSFSHRSEDQLVVILYLSSPTEASRVGGIRRCICWDLVSMFFFYSHCPCLWFHVEALTCLSLAPSPWSIFHFRTCFGGSPIQGFNQLGFNRPARKGSLICLTTHRMSKRRSWPTPRKR